MRNLRHRVFGHRPVWTVLAGLAVAFAASQLWHSKLAGGITGAPVAAAPLRTAPQTLAVNDANAADSVVEMGATFHFLEGRAKRVTTRFKDYAAVAERRSDGTIHTSLADAAGNPVSQLAIEHQDSSTSDVLFKTPDEQTTLRVRARAEFKPTLDWANLQAYAFHRDGDSEKPEWKGRFVRSHESRAADNLDEGVQEMRTEFDGAITARSTRSIDKRVGAVDVTTLYDNGLEVGRVLWVPGRQLLMFRFPGVTEGSANADSLKAMGGWKFRPSMAWATVQALAFYDFHKQMSTKGKVARNWLDRAIDAIEPSLSADAGCDGLHWLDGSIFRPCCDRHDLCYEKNGCSTKSWYWLQSWSCTYCNVAVVSCFQMTAVDPYSCWVGWLYMGISLPGC